MGYSSLQGSKRGLGPHHKRGGGWKAPDMPNIRVKKKELSIKRFLWCGREKK